MEVERPRAGIRDPGQPIGIGRVVGVSRRAARARTVSRLPLALCNVLLAHGAADPLPLNPALRIALEHGRLPATIRDRREPAHRVVAEQSLVPSGWTISVDRWRR